MGRGKLEPRLSGLAKVERIYYCGGRSGEVGKDLIGDERALRNNQRPTYQASLMHCFHLESETLQRPLFMSKIGRNNCRELGQNI